jgi:hypothetical protein
VPLGQLERLLNAQTPAVRNTPRDRLNWVESGRSGQTRKDTEQQLASQAFVEAACGFYDVPWQRTRLSRITLSSRAKSF